MVSLNLCSSRLHSSIVSRVKRLEPSAFGLGLIRLNSLIRSVTNPCCSGFKLLNFDAGVDSGQFGFFDRDFYRNDEIAKDLPKHDFGDDYDVNEGDSWYRAVCDLTLAEESWGVLSGGVVSTSGFGDGSYNVYGSKDESGEYVAFYVEFIGSHDEHEDDWGDDEDDDWG